MLTAQRLREALNYEPDTGAFTWRIATGRRRSAGDPAGRVSDGYVGIQIDGRRYQAHRLAWLYVHGVWPNKMLDHKNGDRGDNRIANLRDVSNAVNGQNRHKPNKNNPHGFLGVSRLPSGKYVASIHVGSEQRHLGCFASPEVAGAAYVAAKKQLHPESNAQ